VYLAPISGGAPKKVTWNQGTRRIRHWGAAHGSHGGTRPERVPT
jgi:hypothetical protein